MMKLVKRSVFSAVMVVSVAGLSACASSGADVDLDWQYSKEKTILSPLRFDEDSVSRNDLAKVRKLGKQDYSFELVRMQDRRIPVAKSLQIEDGIIYEYVPDSLFSGLEGYVGSALKRFLTFGPPKETSFKMEYEIRNVRTYIATGDFFSGMFGKYIIDMEMDVIARDSTSKAIFKDTIKLSMDEPRLPVKGQHPSSYADAQQMDKMMRTALRKVAIHSAWRVHKIAKKAKNKSFNYLDEGVWEESRDR